MKQNVLSRKIEWHKNLMLEYHLNHIWCTTLKYCMHQMSHKCDKCNIRYMCISQHFVLLSQQIQLSGILQVHNYLLALSSAKSTDFLKHCIQKILNIIISSLSPLNLGNTILQYLTHWIFSVHCTTLIRRPPTRWLMASRSPSAF